MPRVSIIIPTFNRSNLLVEAVESVQTQTFKDLEIIVIDDGSNDNTADVVQAIYDPRITYFFQENTGRSAARNKGIQLARGELIGFLDDDDLYMPNKLAREVEFLDSHPEIDFVCSGSEYRRRNDEARAIWQPWVSVPEISLIDVLFRCSFLPISVLINRRIFQKLDYCFDEDLKLAEDTDFFIRLALCGCNMAYLREVLSVYRDHEGRSMKSIYLNDHYRRIMLDKIFARADLPTSIKELKSTVYRHYYLFSACRNYSCRWVSGAQRNLLHAWLQHEGSKELFAKTFVVRIVGMATQPLWVKESIHYINYIFDHLPAPLSWIEDYRNEAILALHRNTI